MGWKERLNLTVAILVALLPVAINLMLLVRRKEYLTVAPWRYGLATGGLVSAVIASLPMPLFYFALELPWHLRGDWVTLLAAYSMPACLVAGLLALVLLAFGKGRARWMGIGATLLAVIILYVTLMGLSD